MGWLETVMLAAFTAGLMGGMHCAAMCGGIVCLFSSPANTSQHPSQRASRWSLALTYNAGRIVSYSVAGAIAGAAGNAGLLLRGVMPVQQAFMFAAGFTLCVMALYLAGVSPLIRSLESAGTVLWRQIEPLAKRMLPVDSVSKALGLGLVWGWLPCGMVYAALLLALSSGHPLDGALVMLAFGLGTLPNMLLMTGAIRGMQRVMKQRAVRLAVAGLLAAGGLFGIVHAMMPGAGMYSEWFCSATSRGLNP